MVAGRRSQNCEGGRLLTRCGVEFSETSLRVFHLALDLGAAALVLGQVHITVGVVGVEQPVDPGSLDHPDADEQMRRAAAPQPPGPSLVRASAWAL